MSAWACMHICMFQGTEVCNWHGCFIRRSLHWDTSGLYHFLHHSIFFFPSSLFLPSNQTLAHFLPPLSSRIKPLVSVELTCSNVRFLPLHKMTTALKKKKKKSIICEGRLHVKRASNVTGNIKIGVQSLVMWFANSCNVISTVTLMV